MTTTPEERIEKIENALADLSFWNELDTDGQCELRSALQHQLQKARHDWLRDEIVRLKDRQRGWLGKEEDGSDRHECYDELQTIIDRYHSELDQEVSK